MRKLFMFLLLFVTSQVQALEMNVELKAGYFTPTSHRLDKMFSGAGVYSVAVTARTWEELHLWAEVGNYSKAGRSMKPHHKARIDLVPVTLGAKYIYDIERVHPHFGIGIQPTHVHMLNHQHHVKKKMDKWTVCGIVETGIMFDVTKEVFLDLFVSYVVGSVHFDHRTSTRKHRVDVGGSMVGLGLGYRF